MFFLLLNGGHQSDGCRNSGTGGDSEGPVGWDQGARFVEELSDPLLRAGGLLADRRHEAHGWGYLTGEVGAPCRFGHRVVGVPFALVAEILCSPEQQTLPFLILTWFM